MTNTAQDESQLTGWDRAVRLPVGLVVDWGGFLYQAWCFSLLWAWLITPIGAPVLHFFEAAGVLLLVSLVQLRAPIPALVPKTPYVEKWRGSRQHVDQLIFVRIGTNFSRPTLLLFVGWGIKTFLTR